MSPCGKRLAPQKSSHKTISEGFEQPSVLIAAAIRATAHSSPAHRSLCPEQRSHLRLQRPFDGSHHAPCVKNAQPECEWKWGAWRLLIITRSKQTRLSLPSGKTPNWGLCPQTPGILSPCARIPGNGRELRSHPSNPGRWVGAQVASPQSLILRPGRTRISKLAY
jgi:hypothetical protein